MKDCSIPGNYKWTCIAIAHFQILFNTPVVVVMELLEKKIIIIFCTSINSAKDPTVTIIATVILKYYFSAMAYNFICTLFFIGQKFKFRYKTQNF